MNYTFGFHLPTRIEAGIGMINLAGKLTKEVTGGSRALIVTDPGIEKVGLAAKVSASLLEAGYTVQLFNQVEPNPKDRDCERGGQIARQFKADVIVAVGGGSVLDAAKAIALMQTHPGNLKDYEGRGKVTREIAPLVAVPTTAGTGSEVTRSAVITDTDRKFKMTVKDVKLAPRLAVVDPETTYALPPSLTASTGMDALVHALEAYTCRAANAISDALALAAMARIYPALRPAVHSGDIAARYDLMIGSLMAGMAFSHSDVASVHCMAEALGGLYDTPHGAANSIFLPIITAYNAPADPLKHAQAAQSCGLPVQGLSADEAADLLVTELAKLRTDIGIPSFNSIPGVKPEDFAFLAQSSYRNGSTPSNCREITESDYLFLFKEAFYQE